MDNSIPQRNDIRQLMTFTTLRICDFNYCFSFRHSHFQCYFNQETVKSPGAVLRDQHKCTTHRFFDFLSFKLCV